MNLPSNLSKDMLNLCRRFNSLDRIQKVYLYQHGKETSFLFKLRDILEDILVRGEQNQSIVCIKYLYIYGETIKAVRASQSTVFINLFQPRTDTEIYSLIKNVSIRKEGIVYNDLNYRSLDYYLSRSKSLSSEQRMLYFDL